MSAQPHFPKSSRASSSTLVSERVPELGAILDALTRYSRSLMDATEGAEALFASEFDGRAEVTNLVPTSDKPFTVVSRAIYELKDQPVDGTESRHGFDVRVSLISSTDKPQKWAITFCGVTIAEQVLSDRSAWAKLPEGAPNPGKDEGWTFSRIAMDQFVNLSTPVYLHLLKEGLSAAARDAARLLEEVRSPAYSKKSADLRNARWAGAFAKKAGAVSENAALPTIDMGTLMGRISSGSRKLKPG